MSMKPRLPEASVPFPGTVSQSKIVDEFGNVPLTVSDLKQEPKSPDQAIPGVVSQKRGK